MAKIIYGNHTYGKITPMGTESGKIFVGKYCSLSADVEAFLAKDHNLNLISTYPFTHRKMPITKLIRKPPHAATQHYNLERRPEIHIGNDVWIGQKAIIFAGVTVGDGACIGAFTIVTKNIPPYSVVVGHSRIVRTRFSAEDVEFLLKLKWWDFDDQTVADIAPILHTSDVDLLRQWAGETGLT
jgi:chloramphenicol O-acetyltransferase type B